LVALLCLPQLLLAAPQVSDGYFMTSDHLRIHYLEQGSGVPVVLIHGYTGYARGNWFDNGIAAELAKTHRVIALDCRGHGQSDKPHDTNLYGPQMENDVIELMDHLRIRRAHIHGYSMGGDILTQILVRHPERVITAIYGGDGVEEVDPRWIAKLPPDIERTDPDEEKAEAILEALANQDTKALYSLRHYPGKEWGKTPIDLRTVTVPVLALVGELDHPNRRLTRMKRELSNFQFEILTGKSHLTAIMAGFIPPTYISTLTAFIRANDPR
jgi:pimeloyl-ACP methyl ester carboxylesterase